MRVLVTGASGFVGRAVVERLQLDPDCHLIAPSRHPGIGIPAYVETVVINGEPGRERWSNALNNVGAVVHLAGRAHILRDAASDPLAEYRRVNVGYTLEVARQAAACGVRRFVFVSSIKVNGEQTAAGRPFRPGDPPAPADAYAQSKYEAEQQLRQLAGETGLELTVIRPPLVYGPGVRANFKSIMGWVRAGIPLPVGAIRNNRSLIALDNLADLIAICVRHLNAPNKTFLASDGEDLSTPELVRRIAKAMNRQARIVTVPVPVLEAAARIFGKREMARRLCGSLQVDIAETCQLLDWTPRTSVDAGLEKAVSYFLRQDRCRS